MASLLARRPRDLAAVAALSGLFGILYFKKNSDASSAGEKSKKDVLDNKKPVNEPVISNASNRAAIKQEVVKQVGVTTAAFKNNNGNDFSLENYLAEMTEAAAAHKKARHEREVAETVVLNEEDEAAMKARFEDWMEEYGRTYTSEEEKSRRYEIFKSFAKGVDKATAEARGGARFITNHTADWTEEEFRSAYCCEVDWDEYLHEIKCFIAKKKAKDVMDVADGKASQQD